MKRYMPLLVALFGFLILQPIAVTLSGANIPLNILMNVLLVTAIYAVGPGKSSMVAATVIALAIVASRLVYESNPNVKLLMLNHGLSFVLMALVTATIVVRVFKARDITAEIVIGAVCVYLILGAAWTFLYFFLQVAAPGSMMALPIASSGAAIPPLVEQYRFWEMLYFSMSAISTMGFLSTEPLTPLARQLAVVEAITGQLYVAVLIARIVALSTAGAMKSGPPAD
jgi:Ion channel